MNGKLANARPFPVLSMGFRPFYLLAAAFAVPLVLLWQFRPGGGLVSGGYLAGLAWHVHEMVFGFAAAVLTGFLLTAARSWTGMESPSGARLAALAGIWAAGRILVVTGPAIPAIVVDCLFLPCVALVVAAPVVRARNYRNLPVAAAPAVLAAANLLFHLEQVDLIGLPRANGGAMLALDVFALLIALMAGRIIPAFTANAVPTARPRRNRVVEIVSFASLGVLAIVGVGEAWLVPDGTWLAAVAAIAAIAHGVRLWLWDPASTLREPLLWVLPLSYAWLPAALALRALSLADLGIPAASAVHAFGIGAMGGLMLGMMTRSALGHTGRALAAGPAETAGFVLIHLAATVRVFGPLAAPEMAVLAAGASAALWAGAFVIFLAAYWPILTRARVDEKPAREKHGTDSDGP